MNYADWEASAPDVCWSDVSKLTKDTRTKSLSNQLYRAVGSIVANLEEGYSKLSAKDRARFYEYALGSGTRKQRMVLSG